MCARVCAFDREREREGGDIFSTVHSGYCLSIVMPYSVVGKLGTGLLWVSMLDMNAAGYTYRLWERPRRGQKEVEHTPVQCAECAVYEDTN